MTTWYSSKARTEHERQAALLQVAITERDLLRAETERLRAELRDSRGAYDALVRTVVDLKREGFHPTIPVAQPPAREPEEPTSDALQQALMARADPDSPLYHQLWTDARRMIEVEQMSEDQAIEITLRGRAALLRKDWIEEDEWN